MLGLQQNQLSLKVSTDASNGPVLGFSVSTSQAVGAFFSPASPRLEFEPGRTGEPVRITFRFVATMRILEEETITLSLPGFSAGRDIAALAVSDVVNSGRYAASWAEDAAQLTLTFLVGLQNDIAQVVTIPVSQGIALPSDGVILDSPQLLISSDAARGPVPPIPVAYSQAVGVFDERALAFSPAVASAVVSVALSFQLNRPIMPGEIVAVTLKGRAGFSGQDACGSFLIPSDETWNTTGNASAWFPTVTLEASAGRLVLTAAAQVAAHSIVNVTVPALAGVVSPDCGIQDNQADIVIETNAEAGPVMPVPMRSAGLGSFRSTELVFDPPRVNATTKITARFRPTMVLELGSTVTLALAGFSGPDQAINVTSKCCGAARACMRFATWHAASSSLVLTVTEAVPYTTSFCSIEVEVARSYGITIPPSGSREDDGNLTIAADSPDGVVLPVSVMRSPGIYVQGGLLFSSVSFGGDSNGPSATNFTDIVIQVRAIMLSHSTS